MKSKQGSIPKTVMKGITSDQNGDFKTTPIFPGEENRLDFRPRSPFLPVKEPRPLGLQTVFSITHSDHSIMPSSLNANTEIEILTPNILHLNSATIVDI